MNKRLLQITTTVALGLVMTLGQFVSVKAGCGTLGFVGDINPNAANANPKGLFEVNGTIYFSANDGNCGTELWRYDRTNAPELVDDIRPGSASSDPQWFVLYNGKLIFTALNSQGIRTLWYYDFVNDPAEFGVHDMVMPDSDPSFTKYNNYIYFAAEDSQRGRELWMYDGYNDPHIVGDLNPGLDGSRPNHMVVFNNKLYFAAEHETKGKELWMYDGGIAHMIHDIWPGYYNADPRFLFLYKNKIFFTCTYNYDTELWQFNGQSSPTRVMNINSSVSSDPQEYTPFRNEIYFTANDGVHGRELWRFDGVDDPELVMDIREGSAGTVPLHLEVCNDILFFSGRGNDDDRELWCFDGIEAKKSHDINLYDDSDPSDLLTVNSKLYFSADDGIHGRELWSTECQTFEKEEFFATFNSGDLKGVWYREENLGDWQRITYAPAKLIATGDMDGDGKDDLIAVYTHSNFPGVWIKYSDSGNWRRLTSTIPKSLSIGDMNGDVAADVVASFSNGVYYYNDKTDGWVRTDSDSPSMITTGDLDGDGIDELIELWNGKVWARFSAAGNDWEVLLYQTPTDMTCGDINGDGRTDFIYSTSSEVWWRNSLDEVWTQLGTEIHTGASTIATSDLDGDGADDLLAYWDALYETWVRFSYPQSGTSQWQPIAPAEEKPHDLSGGNYR